MAKPTQEEVAAAFRRDDERNRDLYTHLLAQHGPTANGVNWSSAASQRTRFKIITEVGIDAEASVLDVGCGTGDLLDFMCDGGFRGSYRGIDLTPVMIETARRRFPNVGFDIVNLLDLSPTEVARFSADIVVASGIFYFRREESVSFMHAMIKRMFSLCGIATVFNSLSTWVDQPSDTTEFHADPFEVLEFCRSVTPLVAMRHDYHPGDFTVYMRRSIFASSSAKQV